MLSLSQTTPEQLRKVLTGLNAVVDAHDRTLDGYWIRFADFGDVSFDIKVFVYVDTRDMAEYQRIVEELNLGFLEVVTDHGAGFAERVLSTPR